MLGGRFAVTFYLANAKAFCRLFSLAFTDLALWPVHYLQCFGRIFRVLCVSWLALGSYLHDPATHRILAVSSLSWAPVQLLQSSILFFWAACWALKSIHPDQRSSPSEIFWTPEEELVFRSLTSVWSSMRLNHWLGIWERFVGGSNAGSGQVKPYEKPLFKSWVHTSMIAKIICSESIFCFACVTAKTGMKKKPWKCLYVKRVQFTMRLCENWN